MGLYGIDESVAGEVGWQANEMLMFFYSSANVTLPG